LGCGALSGGAAEEGIEFLKDRRGLGGHEGLQMPEVDEVRITEADEALPLLGIHLSEWDGIIGA